MKRELPKKEKVSTVLLRTMETKKETLEEAAEIFYSEQSKAYEDAIEPMFDNSRYLVAGFIDGAKWQQEKDKKMYSEEEVYFILCEHTAELFKGSKLTLTEWFEKFKKNKK
jgi:hypothetical protein